MVESPGGPWFVLHTSSNREKVVAAHLAGREVEHYLPSYRSTRTRCDREVTLEAPLFPGYVFARFARHQQLSVITVPGLVRILEAPGGLATVADTEIRSLREAVLLDPTLLPAVAYRVGDRVRILRGAFEGYHGTVCESKARCARVVISIGNLHSCSFSLEADRADIDIVSMAAEPASSRLYGQAFFGSGLPAR